MKKFFFGILLLVLAGSALVYTQASSVMKAGVEAAGEEALKVGVTVGGISISPFSGELQVTELAVAQPDGFGDGPIMQVGDFKMKVEPATLLNDHIIIDEITIDRPMFDARLMGGQTNFQELQKRLATGPETSSGPPITLTIRKLNVTSPQVAVSSDGVLKVDEDVQLADFDLSNLGTDEKGLSPREIARHLMDALQPQIAQAMVSAGVGGDVKELAKGAREKLEGSVGNILGKLRGKKDDNN